VFVVVVVVVYFVIDSVWKLLDTPSYKCSMKLACFPPITHLLVLTISDFAVVQVFKILYIDNF